MKLGNPWTFGILFTLAFCYLAWNNFKFPKYFWGETKETQGIIVDSKRVPRLPYRLEQLIIFAYQVDDSVYIGKHNVNHAKYQSRPIGSNVKIRYHTDDPSDFEVLNYYKFDNYSHKRKYLWQEDFKEYDELYMENGIVKLKHKSDGRKLLSSFLGQSKTKKDTTLVVPIFKPFTSENTVMCLVKSKSHKKETLMDTVCKKSYWRITKS